MTKKIISALCISLLSGLLFANVYISMVDAHSWASDIPQSIYAQRAYFKTANPGDFFRLFSPITIVLLLLQLFLNWKAGSRMRILCISALLVLIGADAFTFGYFYPRNDIMLHEADVEKVRTAVHEWISMDRLRTLMVAIDVVLCFVIQAGIYSGKGNSQS